MALTPTSAIRQVTVDGTMNQSASAPTGPSSDTYSIAKGSNSLTVDFNGDIKGSIPMPTDATVAVDSAAKQQSSLNGGQLTVSGTVSAQNNANAGAPVQMESAVGTSTFDVSFTLSSAASLTLALECTGAAGHGAMLPQPTFSLTGPGGEIVGVNDLTPNQGGWLCEKTFPAPAGSYQIVFNVTASVIGDPLGDLTTIQFTFSLH